MSTHPILFFLLVLASSASAQIGFSGSFLQAKAPDWEAYYLDNLPVPDEHFYREGFQVGLDYWFRLKKVRIEFTPGITFSQLTHELEVPASAAQTRFRTQVFGAGILSNIYLFDLADDCDCPTFSKQDPLFQKGLFFQLGGGIDALSHQSTLEYLPPIGPTIDPNTFIERASDLAYHLSAGAGLDIGLSDLLTLTPFVRYTYFIDASWAGFDQIPVPDATQGDPIADSQLFWLEGGLHIGLRWKK